MAITAADIHNQNFSIERKGYDVDEVDVFLEHVADEIDDLNAHIASLEAQLEDAKFAGLNQPAAQEKPKTDSAAVEIAKLERIIEEKDTEIAKLNLQVEEHNADNAAISQALITAQRSADELLKKANAQVEETMQDARDEAARILDRANSDKQDILEAIRKLEDDREDAREGYQNMLKDFISDASRKLVDLGGTVSSVSSYSSAPSTRYVEEPVIEEYDDDEDEVSYAADYVPPTATGAVAAVATSVSGTVEKDLSGFGDADDFEFEEID